MNRTIFLAIIAGLLTTIAILLFTTGCDNQPDAKTMQQNTETSTSVAETTAREADSTVATKPPETTKATTASTEAQTQDPKEDPTQEQFSIEQESNYYDIYYNEPDFYESDYDNSSDQVDNNYEYDEPTEHEHLFYGYGTRPPYAHSDGYTLYVCDCGESYTEPISCTGDEEHLPELMDIIDEYESIVDTPAGPRYRLTTIYRCPICGYEIEQYAENE